MTEATRKNPFSLINAMEDDLNTVQWFAVVTRSLGPIQEAIAPEAIFALGRTLEQGSEGGYGSMVSCSRHGGGVEEQGIMTRAEGSVANIVFQGFSYGDCGHSSGDRDVQRQAF